MSVPLDNPTRKHMHEWVRKPEEDEFRPCECGEPPPPFANDLPRGKEAAKRHWDDWLAFSGERHQ